MKSIYSNPVKYQIGDRVSFRGGLYDAIVTATIIEIVSTEIVNIYRVQIGNEYLTHFHSATQTKYESHLTEVESNEYTPKSIA